MSSQASSRLKRLQIMALLFLLVAGIINCPRQNLTFDCQHHYP